MNIDTKKTEQKHSYKTCKLKTKNTQKWAKIGETSMARLQREIARPLPRYNKLPVMDVTAIVISANRPFKQLQSFGRWQYYLQDVFIRLIFRNVILTNRPLLYRPRPIRSGVWTVIYDLRKGFEERRIGVNYKRPYTVICAWNEEGLSHISFAKLAVLIR